MWALAESMIGEGTGVTLAALAIIGFPVIGIGVTMIRRLDRVNAKIDGMWSVRDQQMFAMKLKMDNPALNVPEPGSIQMIGKKKREA